MNNNSTNPRSFPNQRHITIHKPDYEGNFVQVAFDEWQDAFARLPRISFGLYLYLCGNQNKYGFYFSPAHVQNALNVSESSVRRAVEDLLGEGYLIMRNGNEHTLDFYTTPQPTSYVKKDRKKKKPATDDGGAEAAPVFMDDIPDEPPADEAFDYYASIASSLYR